MKIKEFFKSLLKQEDEVKSLELIKGERVGIFGLGYPTGNKFHGVDIEVKNNDRTKVVVRLTDTGLAIDLASEN